MTNLQRKQRNYIKYNTVNIGNQERRRKIKTPQKTSIAASIRNRKNEKNKNLDKSFTFLYLQKIFLYKKQKGKKLRK